MSYSYIYPQDTTTDKEANYLSKVKESMNADGVSKVTSVSKNTKPGYFSYVKLLLTLLLVVAMIYGVYFVLKKITKSNQAVVNESAVLLTQPIGAGKNVQVVYIAGKYLVLGVTGENINYLSEINDEKEIERLEILYNDKKAKMGDSFLDLIQGLFNRSGSIKDEGKKFDYEEDTIDFIKKQNDRLNNIKKDN